MKTTTILLLILFLFSCGRLKIRQTPGKQGESQQDKNLRVFNTGPLEEGAPHKVLLEVPRFEESAAEVKDTAKKAMDNLAGALDEIAALDKGKVTFLNTIVALEAAYEKSSEDYSRLSLLKSTSLNKKLRETAKKAQVELEKFFIDQGFREDVYDRIHAFELTGPELEGAEKRLFDKAIREYRRQGMNLPAESKKRVKALKKEISELEIKIESNIAEDETVVLLTKKEVEGIPKDQLESLKKMPDGKYRVQVKVHYEANVIFTYAPQEEVRKKVYKARTSRQALVNAPLMKEVLEKKSQLANLLGYKSWAAYQLEITMAKTPAKALAFEKKLVSQLDNKFQGELKELLKLKISETKNKKALIQAWDISYYKRIYEKKTFNLDLDQLKKYFSMETVLEGMFALFEELFELEIEYVKAPYVWAKEVKLIKITDSQTKKPLGLVYLDLFPRPKHKKYGHFAMFSIRSNKELEGGIQRRPVAALICNFPMATKDKPSLLTFDHVETLFHEFGHALHEVLSESKYSSLSGTNVPRDFVEAPSQMLENWLLDKNVLDRFAINYKDPSDKVPADILLKIKKASRATKGIFYRRQLSFGILDLELHNKGVAETKKIELVKDTNKALKDIYLPFPAGSSFITAFGHIFGGYDARYYGYAWSDNIASDMASIFENSKKGFLDREVGMRLRREVYEKGSTRDVNESVEAFLKRKPNSKAFFKKIGI